MNKLKWVIPMALRAWARGLMSKDDEAPAAVERFRPPEMLPGVIDPSVKLALDSDMSDVYRYANQSMGCFDSFPGYPLLAQLTQQAEYRMLSEKTAMAMVRKWVKLRSKGDDDKTQRIGEIEEEMVRLKVRELFGECAKFDGFFGRAQLFIDMGVQEGSTLPIALFMDKSVVKDKLRKFKVIEAMVTYPNQYSSSNPMADDYYNPTSWFVMGQIVHSTRLLTFVSRPVPDMLKPMYNFGGLSMTQLAMPYVQNWMDTRKSCGKLLRNFSTSGLATNMAASLMGGEGDDLLGRAQLYTEMKDNQDLMLIDKDTEEFFQFNVPLSTVDKLQAQAQEHMAMPSSMPLSILLGVTPTGLNASTDGEIRIFYDHVADMQNVTFKDNLVKVIELIQLSKYGDIDPEITFDFVPLWEQNDAELAANRKSDAEAADILINAGVVSPEEVRAKMAKDEHSGYNGLDLGVIIEPPADPEAMVDPVIDPMTAGGDE